MQIYIDNKPAVIKQGTSFDYVAENPLFTGAEGYTLTITLPLRGCSQNQAIFGHINRADVLAKKILIDGSIVDRNLTKHGSFAITEISELEVKVQFLEGRSESNYGAGFGDVYINELELGEYPVEKGTPLPRVAWNPYNYRDEATGLPQYVALPYIFKSGSNWNTTGGNQATWMESQNVNTGVWSWHWEWYDGTKLTWQPYLLFITQKMCEALGYDYDFSQWENHNSLKYLLICNTLPSGYGLKGFARALPHWTVDEFFQQLEKFLGGDFAIDHRAKTIKFNYWAELADRAGKVELDKLLEEHSVSVSLDDSDCEYLGAKDIKYSDNGSDMWKYLCCPEFVDTFKSYFENTTGGKTEGRVPVLSYLSFDSMLRNLGELYALRNYSSEYTYAEKRKNSPFDSILYCQKEDQYFILYEYYHEASGSSFTQHCDLVPLNIFGDRNLNKENATDAEELKIVPADVRHYVGSIKSASQRNMLRLQPKSYEKDVETKIAGYSLSKLSSDAGSNPWPQQAMKQQTEKEEYPEYYNKIFIAWYDALKQDSRMDKLDNANDNSWPSDYYPYPEISEFHAYEALESGTIKDFSLRLNAKSYIERTGLKKVDPLTKATFKFVSDTIPNPRAEFYIRGKRYLCAKITATFTETGMSQILEGEFYPLVD